MLIAFKFIELQQEINLRKINPTDCFYLISDKNDSALKKLFEENNIKLTLIKSFVSEPAYIIDELNTYCQRKSMYPINTDKFNLEDSKDKNLNFFVFIISPPNSGSKY
jgi:hypothetical protein